MIHIEHHGPVTAIRMARSFLGRPIYWTAAYLVDGLLVDSGPPCTARQLADFLKGPGIEQVIVTHAHEDHFGGLAQLRRDFADARFYAPRGALETIADPSLLHMPYFRRAFWGMPSPVDGVRSLSELEDRIETPSYAFRIIETPGHSPDHISLFEPTQRWLFCADAFIGGKDQSWPPDYELFGVVSSLRTLASLRPERMFPGSGRVRRTPIPDIHAKIGYYTHLAEQVAAHEAEGASPGQTARKLLGGDARMRIWTGGYFSAMNLIQACRSYNGLVRPHRTIYVDEDTGTQAGRRENPIGPPHSRSTDWTR